MSAHSHKRPNPAELFQSAKSDTSAMIELTPSEAFTAISVLAVAADGKISEAERQTLAANHIRLFGSYSGEHFQELFKKVLKLSSQYAPAEVFAAAKNALNAQLRETAFAIATDLVLVDGLFTTEEKDFLVELSQALDISEEMGKKIIEVMTIKNCGDNLMPAQSIE
ncbi:tellurite resistance TerB family protein [Microcoleus sp. bin38.metabat.b11b12b14.051]|uniref:tellurite resistance TerB family protein n=1 Tax=Microcoleus sp. bin38.metabat.b11b12b14.051 TaxID=2742709 RepID=UPI0025CBD98E|nr:tellurite resistance TerB family protein [Microcoleus sp. bin38.metabat.b11b12b14.051]